MRLNGVALCCRRSACTAAFQLDFLPQPKISRSKYEAGTHFSTIGMMAMIGLERPLRFTELLGALAHGRRNTHAFCAH
jgi:hypothetical protein